MEETRRPRSLGALADTKKEADDVVVALAGNPNTGKSTVFNQLTGLRQHTGNWPGKTVASARGRYVHRGQEFTVIDLPGTYSLLANSVEEEIARDFICSGSPQTTVVVTDATCLERNLNLALQIMEITTQVVVCVNLLDEAKRKQISVDLAKLAELLGVPVVGTNARDGKGLTELKDTIYQVARGQINPRPYPLTYDEPLEAALAQLLPLLQPKIADGNRARWLALRLLEQGAVGDYGESNPELEQKLQEVISYLQAQQIDREQLRDRMVSCLVRQAEKIAKQVVSFGKADYNSLDRNIDKIVTSRLFGIPIMLTLLGLAFWITIVGANYPSQLIFNFFFAIEGRLTRLFMHYGWPDFLHGLLVLGVYRTLAWVISVMLPPMAIFFPLFTLLEDLGYLPRIAFNLDHYFKKACAHGKQALTMCMGFGCNAAGVSACRIIDSPRERIIAIVTNNFVPCNGRFPLLIALSSIFFVTGTSLGSSFARALLILSLIVSSVLITFVVSRLLSQTVLKGLPTSFALELPPYRKPQLGRILLRSLLDRTIFVLARAVVVAAPAGALVWLMANLSVGSGTLLAHTANWLHPFAQLIGLDGYILLAFILGLPANEIVIPIVLMSYAQTGTLIDFSNLAELRTILIQNGWTWLTALCTMLFSLNHWPCGTTLLTIRNETQSNKWTILSLLVPTVTGFVLCFLVAQGVRLLGLV
ncbi:MAG: ferrous iron transport protein B [Firmicutes bacterium]|nr:ferrous iron transport protein B [Bacillota bacterium]